MRKYFIEKKGNWHRLQDLPNESFVCGYCNVSVSSVKGYGLGAQNDGSGQNMGGIYICPNCRGPVFAYQGSRLPNPAFGNKVQHVPQELNELYQEARRCTSHECYTAAVLLCRKMLMNVAVSEGADAGKSFIDYVIYLSNKGYVPPNGKHWVDHIRRKGNEATHEIQAMTKDDAEELITFVEMLLKFIFEFPQKVPQPTTPTL